MVSSIFPTNSEDMKPTIRLVTIRIFAPHISWLI
jgi:hypothetical protein